MEVEGFGRVDGSADGCGEQGSVTDHLGILVGQWCSGPSGGVVWLS